jgi:hypothetical protein
MSITNAAQASVKTVADPCAAYESVLPLWQRSRAACSGERYVKSLDGLIGLNNLLLPFSPSMSQEQYTFFRNEAEWPGVTTLFAKTIVGGLLRKQPVLTLPEGVPQEAQDWILNQFAQDDAPLTSFMDAALWEELQAKAWVFVDYPQISEADLANMTAEEMLAYKPYPVLQAAESVINWKESTNAAGKKMLSKILVRGMRESFEENEFHPTFVESVWVHELDTTGHYQIRVFEKKSPTGDVPVISGQRVTSVRDKGVLFVETDSIVTPMMNGERLSFIPAWPLNGVIGVSDPMLAAFIDKEVALYNKISRRNHLLLGAATYTPVISSDMSDKSFDEIVNKGLGSWIKVGENDKVSVLDTPTAALIDMDRAIASGFEELAKMGIRMLTPEVEQSGIALQLRNASQTAQLSSLNMKSSNTLRQVIVTMLNWRYGLELSTEDVTFTLSSDFLASQSGPDWLRLATEWYETGKIPRSAWLHLLKQNDMLSPDYDDEEGQQEITEDLDLINGRENTAYADKLKLEQDFQTPPTTL